MYLGVDVGSVSTDIVLLDEELKVLDKHYLKTQGSPVRAVQEGLLRVRRRFGDARVKAAGATGSGRQVAAAVMGADAVKNEITAHAVAALHLDPGVRTVIEIGGQDSKIIVLKDGVAVDFAMNTVCAAGEATPCAQKRRCASPGGVRCSPSRT